jgi:chromatin remodeling complex protein RSC6
MAVAKAKKRTKAKKTTKAKAKRKPNPAFMKPLAPSSALAEIVGSRALPRTQVVKKLWEYIKKHKCQDKKNRRMINSDAKLKAVFGRPKFSMFEMNKLLKKHLK